MTWREVFEKEQGKYSKEMDRVLRKRANKLTGNEDYSGINYSKANAQDAGCYWYVWRTCEDQRVRKSHRKMNNVLVNYDDPPSPELLVDETGIGRYHAGELKDCRCYDEPLVEINDVRWPHRVYFHGAIVRMKKAEFIKILNYHNKISLVDGFLNCTEKIKSFFR